MLTRDCPELAATRRKNLNCRGGRLLQFHYELYTARRRFAGRTAAVWRWGWPTLGGLAGVLVARIVAFTPFFMHLAEECLYPPPPGVFNCGNGTSSAALSALFRRSVFCSERWGTSWGISFKGHNGEPYRGKLPSTVWRHSRYCSPQGILPNPTSSVEVRIFARTKDDPCISRLSGG